MIAGSFEKHTAPPAPDSWAATANNQVAIWHIKMDAGGKWLLPAASEGKLNRTIYFFKGDKLQIG